MLEGLRQADEATRLLPALPQPGDTVELAVDPSEIPAGLHPITEEVLALLSGPRRFQELVDRCPASDLEVMRAVLALLERGYARRREGALPQGHAELLAPHELHALRARIARGRASGPQTVGKVMVVGGGPLARRAARARLQTIPGYRAEGEPAGRVRHDRAGSPSATASSVDVTELPGGSPAPPAVAPLRLGRGGGPGAPPGRGRRAAAGGARQVLRLPLVVCGAARAAPARPRCATAAARLRGQRRGRGAARAAGRGRGAGGGRVAAASGCPARPGPQGDPSPWRVALLPQLHRGPLLAVRFSCTRIVLARLNPHMVDAKGIAEAHRRIAPHVRRTPVLRLGPGDLPGLEVEVALKLECLQRTGSFKIRGAFNRILCAEVPAAGVVAASGGNHGAAVAAAARELGIPARIFVPRTSPAAKVARIRGYGAEVVVGGASYADARAAAEAHGRETGALDVPAFDDPLVVAGQGTAALELREDAPFDTLLVAVGGGGLAAGCAAALFPRGVRVVGVETDRHRLVARRAAGGRARGRGGRGPGRGFAGRPPDRSGPVRAPPGDRRGLGRRLRRGRAHGAARALGRLPGGGRARRRGRAGGPALPRPPPQDGRARGGDGVGGEPRIPARCSWPAPRPTRPSASPACPTSRTAASSRSFQGAPQERRMQLRCPWPGEKSGPGAMLTPASRARACSSSASTPLRHLHPQEAAAARVRHARARREGVGHRGGGAGHDAGELLAQRRAGGGRSRRP